jgi:hypothetical protein
MPSQTHRFADRQRFNSKLRRHNLDDPTDTGFIVHYENAVLWGHGDYGVKGQERA